MLFCPATAGLRKIRPTFSSPNISSFSLLTFAIVHKITSRFLPPTLAFPPARSELSLIQKMEPLLNPLPFPAYHKPPISEILTNPHGCRYTARSQPCDCLVLLPEEQQKAIDMPYISIFPAFCFPALDRIREGLLPLSIRYTALNRVTVYSRCPKNSRELLIYWLYQSFLLSVFLLWIEFVMDYVLPLPIVFGLAWLSPSLRVPGTHTTGSLLLFLVCNFSSLVFVGG